MGKKKFSKKREAKPNDSKKKNSAFQVVFNSIFTVFFERFRLLDTYNLLLDDISENSFPRFLWCVWISSPSSFFFSLFFLFVLLRFPHSKHCNRYVLHFSHRVQKKKCMAVVDRGPPQTYMKMNSKIIC